MSFNHRRNSYSRNTLSGSPADLVNLESVFVDNKDILSITAFLLPIGIKSGVSALNLYFPGLGTAVQYLSSNAVEAPLGTAATIYKLGLTGIAKCVPKMYAIPAIKIVKNDKLKEIFGDAYTDALVLEWSSSYIGRGALEVLGINYMQSERFALHIYQVVKSTGAPEWSAQAAAAYVAGYSTSHGTPGYRNTNPSDPIWRKAVIEGTNTTDLMSAVAVHAKNFTTTPISSKSTTSKAKTAIGLGVLGVLAKLLLFR